MTAIDLLCGRGESHLSDDCEFGCRVHRAVVTPLLQLRQDAAVAGFDLQVASGFRRFDRQLQIWNDKAAGRRALLSAEGKALDVHALSDYEKVQAILRWSALPGASRHHWGTDIDVYDRAALPEGYRLQLTPEETSGDGPFAPFHRWLDQRIDAGEAQGFIRPYDCDRGGVAPEPWHLSYAPLAQAFQQQLDAGTLRGVIEQAELALKTTVLAHFDDIYQRFVFVPSAVYARGASSNRIESGRLGDA